MKLTSPHINEIRALAHEISKYCLRTPVLRCHALEKRLGNGTVVYAKMEFLQETGTFKARGAMATLLSLSAEQRAIGVTAVSAGNHAIATAYAAGVVGTSAKVVMLSSANPARIEACRALGAELVLTDDVHSAFEVVDNIQASEGRYLVHPFDGSNVACGTGTVGLEICEQISAFDAVVIPVGGGGLIAGMSNAIRQLRPDAEIIGVEPTGADSMHRSFASGQPEHIPEVTTIADSLGAPFAMQYSFELTRTNVDRLVLVEDDALRRAMGWVFQAMKIAVEPACVASTAALLGPLRDSLRGKTVVLTFCGSNIDWATFERHAIFDAL